MSRHHGPVATTEDYEARAPQPAAVDPVPAPEPEPTPEPDVPENLLSVLREAHAAALGTTKALQTQQAAQAAALDVDAAKAKQKEIVKRAHDLLDTTYGVG